jgi:hypothetical protein
MMDLSPAPDLASERELEQVREGTIRVTLTRFDGLPIWLPKATA